MSQNQPKGVRYSNATNYANEAAPAATAVCRVRGRMSVALSTKRAKPRAPSPPQRETPMPSSCYRGERGAGDFLYVVAILLS